MVIGPGPGLSVVNINSEDIWQLDKSSLFGGGAEIDMEVFIDATTSWQFGKCPTSLLSRSGLQE